MSDIITDHTITALEALLRDAEHDAVAAKARVQAYSATLDLLRQNLPRRPGRPRNVTLVNPPNQHVSGSQHEPETDTLPSLDDVRGILKETAA